jgi:hypothetical protein
MILGRAHDVLWFRFDAPPGGNRVGGCDAPET